MPTPQLGMLMPQLEILTPLRGMGPSEGPYRAQWESILGPRALGPGPSREINLGAQGPGPVKKFTYRRAEKFFA